MQTNVKNFLSWTLIILLTIIGVGIQHWLWLNRDVAWIAMEATKMLEGGQFVHQFFSLNPPLIIYLTLPAAILTKYVGIGLISAMRSYLFLLSYLSLLASSRWLKTAPYKSIFLVFLAFIYFILPVDAFGQREYFMLILSMPYLLSIAVSDQNHASSRPLRIATGIGAALGFLLKPYFIIIPLLLESFYFYQHRDLKTLFRLESLSALMTAIVYFFAILSFASAYLKVIAPFVFHYYLGFANDSLKTLLFNPIGILLIDSLFFSCFVIKKQRQRILLVFLLSNIGMLSGYLIAGQFWYYHAFPLLAYTILSIILGLYFLIQWLSKNHPKRAVLSYLIIFIQILILTAGARWLYQYARAIFKLQYDKQYVVNQLIHYLKTQKNAHSFYAFTTHPDISITVSLYASKKYASRFTDFWMLPKLSIDNSLSAKKEKMRLRNFVTEDFKKNLPNIVFVDTTPMRNYFTSPFDYLKFFKRNKQFKSIWHHYQYQTSIKNYAIYRYSS